MLGKLRQLEEEIPELHIVWNERLAEIHAQVMGEVQIEILKSLIHERFGEWVEFGAGNIVYKETIRSTVEGVGHFRAAAPLCGSSCCWSGQNRAADCRLEPSAARTPWTATGSV